MRPSLIVLAAVLASPLSVAPAAAGALLVSPRSTWRYLDDGSDQGVAWRDPAFNDAAWASGPAQLGYGDGDEATVLGFGPDPTDKYPTTYFRLAFDVPDPLAIEDLTLGALVDDGLVVWLNGFEVVRDNMPAGPADFRTYATRSVGGTDEDAWHPFRIGTPPLVAGRNVLAVEVHNQSAGSSDLGFDLWLRAEDRAERVASLWAGALTPTSIRATARLRADHARVRLLVSEQPDLSAPRASAPRAASAGNDRTVSLAVPGLRPDTAYWYAIEADGTVDRGHVGRFRTVAASPRSYTFSLASCAATGTPRAAWDTLRAHDPLFHLATGDLHYENIQADDPVRFRAAYDAVLASPPQAALFRAAPVAYVWDDHDFGGDGSDGTSPARPAARLVYQERVPHYPLVFGPGDVPVAQAFSVGRVRFLLTDARSEKSPVATPDGPGKTMLGAAQKAWLEGELLAANGVYPLIVWINSVPWISSTGGAVDDWSNYASERAELSDFVVANAIAGLVMVSGDAHMLAIDDGSNNQYAAGGGPAFPVFHAASIDSPPSVKGGPYSHGTFPGRGQFGLMTVEDDGVNPVCFSWSGRDESDAELLGLRRCAAAPHPSDSDGDGHPDVADCAFADPGAWAAPGTVARLMAVKAGAGGPVTLSWTSQDGTAGPATVYDLVGGEVDQLRADRGYDRAQCLAEDLPDTPAAEATPPPPAGALYLLLRAASPCGAGGFGAAGAADPRWVLEGDLPCRLP